MAAAVVAFVLPAELGWTVRGVAGWDAGLLALLGLPWRIILRSDPEMTRERAAAEDPGSSGILLIALVASTVSLAAAIVVLRRPEDFAPTGGASVLVGLGAAAVAGAWALVHTAFALHYARLYYREDGDPGGLDFAGGEAPDDLDFAYVAFSVGMTYQAGDVAISDRGLRRAVLAHALLSFAYNTAVLALAVSVVFGRVR